VSVEADANEELDMDGLAFEYEFKSINMTHIMIDLLFEEPSRLSNDMTLAVYLNK
jgi:hypothetical protein